MLCRFAQIELLVKCNQLDILTLTEARVTEQITGHEISIARINVLRCNSASRHTGDIMCYIRDNISFQVMYNVNFEKSVWLTSCI